MAQEVTEMAGDCAAAERQHSARPDPRAGEGRNENATASIDNSLVTVV
jgi:hypothetical protein